ncbi:MAG: uroporphyrinogen-III synthase [Bradyrhizobium sp.]|uniref:uroporphyrinogen-III synthase n=1 Tax=Bradyrhizobium sp. TaxID=376 RepID=UPI0025C224BA|nr:uroporphyrinogen-III synthase [Bradyrhizobium sp.]MBI5263881.1 uroporphyrinogen-III synthase [Bradyrhizobium sp.]
MAILVTRPHPDSETTAAGLRARGYEVLLAPVLKFEPVAFHDDDEMEYAAVIVTSASAVRAVAPQLKDSRLLSLTLFAVGERTASAAGDAGFAKVIVAGGDAAMLRDCVLDSVRSRKLKKGSTLLYLAGADLSRDLAAELGAHGFNVVTQTTYRMAPIAGLPRQVCEGFANHQIEAVLHYSTRSARAFLDATRAEGVEISALAIPQCCLSENIASALREAGAAQLTVAASPDENALFDALERALRPRLA